MTAMDRPRRRKKVTRRSIESSAVTNINAVRIMTEVTKTNTPLSAISTFRKNFNNRDNNQSVHNGETSNKPSRWIIDIRAVHYGKLRAGGTATSYSKTRVAPWFVRIRNVLIDNLSSC